MEFILPLREAAEASFRREIEAALFFPTHAFSDVGIPPRDLISGREK
jgi:hypothetical protein